MSVAMVVVSVVALVRLLPVGASALEAPVLESRLGGMSNLTRVEDPRSSQQERGICTVGSHDVRQPDGSSEAGDPSRRCGGGDAPGGRVYVAAGENRRV
jgi:hypothetical protein